MTKTLIMASLIAVGAIVSIDAFAQSTCALPIPVAGRAAFSGDTCAGGNPFPSYPGGIPSPQNDDVYSFTAQGANATIAVSAGTGSALLPGWVVLAPCDAVTGNIVASGSNAGGTASGTVSGLTDGTVYYLVVTTDPGAGAADTNCGTYNVAVTGTLPVQLQNFSVN